MNRRQFSLIILLFVTILWLPLTGQNSKLPMGFPDRSPELNVLPGFKNPPKGYGEVSFYWWIGDPLTKERILWQLDQLKDKSITGLQINYCHTDKGGATYGLTYPSQPALFSNQWWELFQWFLKEAKKRDMSVSLSDYTLGAAGQGWFIDEMLNENPNLHGTKLESKKYELAGNQDFNAAVPENILTATAYQNVNGTLSPTDSIDLKPMIKNSELTWKTPAGSWEIVLVYRNNVKTSFDPMNPLSGAKVAEKFYQRFEDHCPGESGQGLNFFFSDELSFGIRGFLWNDAFANEFKKRKGYDILPELTHLFADLGPKSFKIRLDYNDVMVALTEEGFFKPLYEWHTSRGMLFGCDHGGLFSHSTLDVGSGVRPARIGQRYREEQGGQLYSPPLPASENLAGRVLRQRLGHQQRRACRRNICQFCHGAQFAQPARTLLFHSWQLVGMGPPPIIISVSPIGNTWGIF
jgi:hypothetical protein